MKRIAIPLILLIGVSLAFFALFSSCGSSISTEDYGKFFNYVPEFHFTYFSEGIDAINEDDLSLYVDNSTCNVLGQHSAFYQALVPSWVAATKHYYSIKGDSIIEEQGEIFSLLRSIEESNYADLLGAMNRMANGNGESVLLTDGEYYQPSIAKGHINDPYMVEALKTWLKKGHDIFVFSEPYQEPYMGKTYEKKRFYIIFTDVRLKNNIYDRIIQTATLQNFPTVEMFHLSADHPSLAAEGPTSKPNDGLSAKVQGFGIFEAQEWQIDWKNGIEPIIVNAVDSKTGQPLTDGEPFTGGIKVDRNSFGGYRIKDVTAKVYNINQEFTDFCTSKENKMKVGGQIQPEEYVNFIKLDEKEFQTHGIINLHFDTQMYDYSILNGGPYNFFKIDICVSSVEDMFSQFAEMFYFDSIDKPGETNTSVAESIKQCLADPDIKGMIETCPIYSIYVKSLKR